jgi:hypothetical protein
MKGLILPLMFMLSVADIKRAADDQVSQGN